MYTIVYLSLTLIHLSKKQPTLYENKSLPYPL